MAKKFIDVGKGLASLFRRTSEDKGPQSVFQKNLIDTFGEDEVAEGIRIIGTSKQNPDLEKLFYNCLLYTSPSPRDRTRSRMPSSA